MKRRSFLKSAGVVTAGVTSLSGCIGRGFETTRSAYVLRDIGLEKKYKSVGAYAVLENVSDKGHSPNIALAVYDDNVRVSDWVTVDSDNIRPGKKRMISAVWDAGDSGWAKSNDLTEVVKSHSVKLRCINTDGDPTGPTFEKDDIGKSLDSNDV